MANVYSSILEDGAASDWWDGTIAWGYDATDADYQDPAVHANQGVRDAQYDQGPYQSVSAWDIDRDGNSQAGDDEYGIIMGEWDNDEVLDTRNILFDSDSVILRAIGLSRSCHNVNFWDDGANSPYRIVGENWVVGVDFNMIFDGIQLSTSADDAVFNLGGITGSVISNCLVKMPDNGNGLRVNNASAQFDIVNSIFYLPGTPGGSAEGIHVRNCATINIYNCTVSGCNQGMERDNGTVNAHNCIVFNNVTDFDGVFNIIDYCASDDDTGTNSQNLNENGSGEWAAAMPNYVTFDFSLSVGGLCTENGTDDPGSGLYSDDIKGDARTSTWDIGAFEFISGVVRRIFIIS